MRNEKFNCITSDCKIWIWYTKKSLVHQIVCKKPVLDPHAFFSIIPKGGLLSEYNCIQPLLSRSTIWDRVSQTHPPTHYDSKWHFFLAKKAIFQDSSIISKVLFYAFPIHMRKGVLGPWWSRKTRIPNKVDNTDIVKYVFD